MSFKFVGNINKPVTFPAFWYKLRFRCLLPWQIKYVHPKSHNFFGPFLCPGLKWVSNVLLSRRFLSLSVAAPGPLGSPYLKVLFGGGARFPPPSPVFLKGSSLTPDVNFWNIKPFFLHILRIFRVSQTHTHTHKIVLYGKMSNFLNHNKNLNFWKQEPYEKRR